jgi:hypothetical protein
MNRPKYQIGDRFTVMQTVSFEIVDIVLGEEIRYIFQLFDNPVFKSIVTERDLNDILAAQTPPDEYRAGIAIETQYQIK